MNDHGTAPALYRHLLYGTAVCDPCLSFQDRYERDVARSHMDRFRRRTSRMTKPCETCNGRGEITVCANDGRCGCSHQYDQTWTCRDCDGSGVHLDAKDHNDAA